MVNTENRRRPRRTRPSTFVVSRMPLISHVSTVTVSSPVIWHSSRCEKVAARTSIVLAFLPCASHILHALVCCQRQTHENALRDNEHHQPCPISATQRRISSRGSLTHEQ